MKQRKKTPKELADERKSVLPRFRNLDFEFDDDLERDILNKNGQKRLRLTPGQKNYVRALHEAAERAGGRGGMAALGRYFNTSVSVIKKAVGEVSGSPASAVSAGEALHKLADLIEVIAAKQKELDELNRIKESLFAKVKHAL